MAKTKKFTPAAFNKESTELDSLKEIHILDNKYTININKTFKKSEIQKLVLDYMQFVDELKKRPVVEADTILAIPNLLYGLTCKYFSTLPIEFSNLDELHVTTKKLLDMGIIEQLFGGNENTGFDPKQVEILNKTIQTVSKTVTGAMADMALLDSVKDIPQTGEENAE